MAALTATAALGPERTAVVWFDAHGDFNTPETSASGFLDGMAVAMLAGRCWKGMTSKVPGFVPVPESQIVMTGLRALDETEEENVDSSGVHRVAIRDALAAIESISPNEIYLHVDLDVFDPSVGTANSYAVSGGITRNEFMDLARVLQPTVGAMALTAYDPSCDPENRIARLAVDIATAVAAH